jgi:diaminohydroxyphosphoribosylaminopyrimidine deaminase/5-amino-6-(5-phosphoribosylamino)uracil reductase
MPTLRHEEDIRWMRMALDLATRGQGRTSPNPLVGAVIVKNGEVVGAGHHERAGRAHAEIVALEEAGARARGSTLYVNLEPCAHTGRTPPCAPAIAEAEVARVVSAMEDPDPRVRGAGHRRLTEAGVTVDVGVLNQEAERINEEFSHRVRTGRAFGILKAAVTLDGRLAADGGDARWITAAAARARAHELRARYDAVLIGRGTLDRDAPSLSVRISGAPRDPLAIVVDSKLTSDPNRKLWRRAKKGAQVIVAATDEAPEDHVRRFEALGVEVLRVPADAEGRVDLGELFRRLANRGVNSILIEGGETVHTAALKAGLVERAHVFIAPRFLGGREGPRLVGDLGLRKIAEAISLVDVKHEILDADVLVSGRLEKSGKES